MNLWDILILFLVAALVLIAFRTLRKGRSGCCSAGCSGCSACRCSDSCASCSKQNERHFPSDRF